MDMPRPTQLTAAALVIALCSLSCNKSGPTTKGDPAAAPVAKIIQGVSINVVPTLDTKPFTLAAARNETASTIIQLSGLPKPREKSSLTLRVQPLQLQSANGQIDTAQFKAYQVLNMPVDANRAGYVRHTGLKATSRTMPRALLPVPMDAGKINVTGLRDPSEPLKPNSRIGLSDEPALLWLDVQVPVTATPGTYTTTIELLRDGNRVDSVPLTLNVYDFVMPVERHLQMVGRIEWPSLETLYPDLFENITPQLMKRGDPKYAEAIRLLDQFVALAHEHRTTVVVPRIQPVVKWPLQVFWDDHDSIVEPWLSGTAFPDRIPAGYWPLPHIDQLDNFKRDFQLQYWDAAVSHFDQKGWADRAWVELEKSTPGRASASECVTLSTQVAEVLDHHPRLRVSLPLEDGQLQFRDASNPRLIDKKASNRLMTAASGLVFAKPGQDWPADIARPGHWLRTDLPGLVPYVGAGGDERDVRVWSWLAFLGPQAMSAQVIGWDGALPHTRSPDEAANPNDLTWFYPGRWFGIDEPVPTIQLKWLRRAQQDYEYLHLARQRGQVMYALIMARRMTRPVQTSPNEAPDVTHALLTGTTDANAWPQALELLAKQILLREPGKARDEQREAELGRDTNLWMQPQEQPLLIGRNASWGWAARPGNWVDLQLGVDAYNPSDLPLEGEFQWTSAPKGWEFNPQPLPLTPADAIRTYQVKRFRMDAQVDLDRLGPETRLPIQLKLVEKQRNRPYHLSVVAPVAACDKREGKLEIDGLLGDWDDGADGIHHGPLVMMLDRPSLQRQAIQMASTHSSIYTNWVDKQFYVAFKVDGVATDAGAGRAERNDVDYQLRRAWGEDLCEVLMQPIYNQAGDVGQIVHVVCKRNGQAVVSIKHSPKNQRLFGSAYKEMVGADLRYRMTAENGVWRGEVVIPWGVINDKQHQGMRPTLMRFNFAQHKHASGESSSWAGPDRLRAGRFIYGAALPAGREGAGSALGRTFTGSGAGASGGRRP
jgi:hypothetical protein